MANWSNEDSLATPLAVTGTAYAFATQSITLAPEETANLFISATFPATPTDDLLYKVQATTNGSNENWADYGNPVTVAALNNDTAYILVKPDPNLYKVRLVFATDGTTDEITVSVVYRANGYRGFQ